MASCQRHSPQRPTTNRSSTAADSFGPLATPPRPQPRTTSVILTSQSPRPLQPHVITATKIDSACPNHPRSTRTRQPAPAHRSARPVEGAGATRYVTGRRRVRAAAAPRVLPSLWGRDLPTSRLWWSWQLRTGDPKTPGALHWCEIAVNPAASVTEAIRQRSMPLQILGEEVDQGIKEPNVRPRRRFSLCTPETPPLGFAL